MTSKIWLGKSCRRTFLRRLGLTAFGAVAFGGALNGPSAAAADRKATQEAVNYRDPAQGASLCGNCKYFQPPSSCLIIEGNIAPTGWCSKYAK